MLQAEVKTIETDEIKSLKAIVSESKQDVSDAVNTRNVLREKLRLVIVWKSSLVFADSWHG